MTTQSVKPPKFQIQQIALVAPSADRAKKMLVDLGLTEWITDYVEANGTVFGDAGINAAELHFNYQSGTGAEYLNEDGEQCLDLKPLELEILDYINGPDWLAAQELTNTVSHLGMHVSAEQLLQYRAYFESEGVAVAQEVITQSHTNEYIANSRRYNYVIFDTRPILGVDLKFIVRLNLDGTPQ